MVSADVPHDSQGSQVSGVGNKCQGTTVSTPWGTNLGYLPGHRKPSQLVHLTPSILYFVRFPKKLLGKVLVLTDEEENVLGEKGCTLKGVGGDQSDSEGLGLGDRRSKDRVMGMCE